MAEVRARRPRIFDAVYGYVDLDENEFRLVNTAIFQRLHWIKQLGPLHTVFPSAQHSRFSHSVGVFYIATKMIGHLKALPEEYGYSFTEDEESVLKFAALLHDIGHVPLSHIGERVLEEDIEARIEAEEGQGQRDPRTLDLLNSKRSRRAWHALFLGGEPRDRTKLHEQLSAEIVLHNQEIDAVLASRWPRKAKRTECKERIAEAIAGTNMADIPTVLLHSELDADRLDYLLRDSFFTGVGYGQVDLDYIISRLVTHRQTPTDVPVLCVEHKGLHTIEHYILGRFFLQTQVIFNRKVRALDLLFEDVMRFMLTEAAPPHCRLMNLQEFCDHIHDAKGRRRRPHLHKIYAFTDAEVFMKMRSLHEHLDQKEREGGADDGDLYVNDCIKTIMDGNVAGPVFHTCHKLVDRRRDRGCEERLKRRADRIASGVVAKFGIYPSRIKTNFCCQEVMKYGDRFMPSGVRGKSNNKAVNIGAEEEPCPEAVKVVFKTPNGGDRVRYAAKCGGTVLQHLVDKALLLFNCYYVGPKGCDDDRDAIETAIKDAFADFIDMEFYQ